MDWLNLHASTLDSSEFIGAKPAQRSTWICLLRFCIGQENGGRIVGADSWGDRRWQQQVRVTLREIKDYCDLWRVDGEDIEVNFYPAAKQKEVEAKRKAGKDTVAKRWGKHDSCTDSSAISSADTEGERNEKGKEKEKPEAQASPVAFPPILDTPEFRQAWDDWTAYRRERRIAVLKPRSVEAQLGKMQFWGHAAAIESIRESIAQNYQGLFEPKNHLIRNTQPVLKNGNAW